MSNIAITYRHTDNSPSLNKTITKRFKKLLRFTDHISNRHVVIETPHKNQNNHNIFRACVEVDLHGERLVVNQDSKYAHISVRDAFNKLERRIKETIKKSRQSRKSIPCLPVASPDLDNPE